jgi:hypothetical protein
MSYKQEDEGVSEALLNRFIKYRLPQATVLKEHVAAGNTLSDGELELLRRMLVDAQRFGKFANQYPKYQELLAGAIDLYHEIVEKALENEGKGQKV